MKTSLLLLFLTASFSAFGGPDPQNQTSANNSPPADAPATPPPQDATAPPPLATPAPEPQQPATAQPAPAPNPAPPQTPHAQTRTETSATATPDQVIKYSYTIARWKHEGKEGWYERTNAHLTTLAGRPPAIPRMELPVEVKAPTALAGAATKERLGQPAAANAKVSDPTTGQFAQSGLPPGRYEVDANGVIRRVEPAEPARTDDRNAGEPTYVIYPDGRVEPWSRFASQLRRGQTASRSSRQPFGMRINWPQVTSNYDGDYRSPRY